MRVLLAIIGIYQAANGIVMLIVPGFWYSAVPGVPDTGPANIHFIRDIGLAFLAAGAALLMASRRPDDGRLIAAATIFLGGHAICHLIEMAHGTTMGAAARDILLIVVPGLLPLAAFPARDQESEVMMFKRLLKQQLWKFENRYGYDTGYMRELVDTDEFGALKLALISPFTNERFSLPAAAYFTARITATRRADCGSCMKLVITLAREAGVELKAIEALLNGAAALLPDEMVLAERYARAVLDNDPELPDIIDACEQRWGKAGVAGLSAAVVSGQLYPTFKRGLGHGNACEPVLAWLKAEAAKDRPQHHAEAEFA
ncbi:hypothetical protein DPM33_14900 [Mesorhizobium hawassense]|uniref:Uncharacterized protein n=1 Tax=Mesorhizobium hawassense TaxID=1209954 RepID=A0A330HQV1_9HYPH|nr:hypothetical protein [Mesorhizobium hawassense]RAZ90118.1 hypothetical protein DPM33_14900 [Mesorhizobium hawassense]